MSSAASQAFTVQPQPILGFGRVVTIALRGVRYRLFRAMVTVAVIAVAMAFLMNILSESLFKRVVAESVSREIHLLREADRWVARLSVPETLEEILRRLAVAEESDAALREMSNHSGLEMRVLQEARRWARDARAYLDFFQTLDYGRRRVLVGSATGTGIFDALQDATALETFESRLAAMRAVRFITDVPTFRAFLAQWPNLRAVLTAVREGQQRALGTIRNALQGRSVLESLNEVTGAFGEAIRRAGYVLEPDEAAALAEQARRVQHQHFIEEMLNHSAVRKAIAAERDILPGDVTVDMIWAMLLKPEGARKFERLLREHAEAPPELDAARLNEVARIRERARLLTRAELLTAGSGGGWLNLGPRMTWLALVSMLVCAVGIANAMLMTVTERFREIATLKCLGALDGFIMLVFLIEAVVLGLVGGIVGTLVGLLLGIGRMAFAFGMLLRELFPGALFLKAAGLSVVTGVALAAVAAVYPSLRAARLAPMEAMRIE